MQNSQKTINTTTMQWMPGVHERCPLVATVVTTCIHWQKTCLTASKQTICPDSDLIVDISHYTERIKPRIQHMYENRSFSLLTLKEHIYF